MTSCPPVLSGNRSSSTLNGPWFSSCCVPENTSTVAPIWNRLCSASVTSNSLLKLPAFPRCGQLPPILPLLTLSASLLRPKIMGPKYNQSGMNGPATWGHVRWQQLDISFWHYNSRASSESPPWHIPVKLRSIITCSAWTLPRRCGRMLPPSVTASVSYRPRWARNWWGQEGRWRSSSKIRPKHHPVGGIVAQQYNAALPPHHDQTLHTGTILLDGDTRQLCPHPTAEPARRVAAADQLDRCIPDDGTPFEDDSWLRHQDKLTLSWSQNFSWNFGVL